MSDADSSRPRPRWPAVVIALSLALGGLALGTAVPIEAQGSGDDGNASLPVGVPVPYESLDGSELMLLTVDEIIDPYETGITARKQEGLSAEQKRLVALRLSLENTAATPIRRFHPNRIKLLDADTVLHSEAFVPRGSEAKAAEPEFPTGGIDAGVTISGLLLYELAEAAEIEAVLFVPSNDRLITLSSRAADPALTAATTDEPAEAEPEVLPSMQPEPAEAAEVELETPAAVQPEPDELDSTGRYDSARFGHHVAWDPSRWSVAEALTESGYDHLALESDVVTILVDGLEDFDGDAQRCLVDQVHGDLDEVTGFDAPADDILPPTADGRLPIHAGLYVVVRDDAGRSHELVRYVECRTLLADKAVLRVVITAPERYWAIDRGLAAEVLSGIELPVRSPDPDATEPPTNGPSSSLDAETVSVDAVPDTETAPVALEVSTLDCGTLLTMEDVDLALAAWERVRAGLDGDTFRLGGGEVCTTRIYSDESLFTRIEPGDPGDFEPGTELLGTLGRRVPAFGDEALLFHTADAGAEGQSILSVGERRDVGSLHFRLTLGRPDLEEPERSLILAKLARDVLPRFPAVPVPATAGRSISLAEALEAEPPDLSNLSFVANLRAKEEAGEWTRGEGLVATLRYFAGELDSSDVLRDADNLGWEGTGILRMATEYLEDGPDEEAKTEIARLVDLLVWTSTELEAMAGITTRDAAALFRPVAAGITAAEFMTPIRPTASTEAIEEACPTFFQGFIDASLPCLEWRTVKAPPGSDGTYRVFVPSPAADLISPPGGWTIAHYDAAVDAVTRSAAWLETTGRTLVSSVGGPGRMNDVDVVFTLRSHHPKGFLATATGPEHGDCSVALYTDLQKATKAQFKQVVAHELAHCFQYANFMPRIHRVKFTDWWVEGTATYLSNVIYPKVDFEWRHEGQALRMLGEKVSLLDLSYATFLFWQFLGNERDNAGIFRLLLGLPTSGGRAEQVERLATSPDMARTFQSFLEAMADGAILDTESGKKNTQPPEPPEWTIDMASEGQVVPFFLQPFQGTRVKIHVPECHVADLEVDQDKGQDGARTMTGKGEWGDLPTTLPAGPDDRTRLWLTSATKNAEVKIVAADVDQDDDPECQDDSAPAPVMPCDLCGASGYFFGDSIEGVGSDR